VGYTGAATFNGTPGVPRRLAKDYEANRYSNSVVIYPVFKNVGRNTIVGLQGRAYP